MQEKIVETILKIDADAPATVKSQVSATKWVLILNVTSLVLLVGLSKVLETAKSQ